MLCDAIGGASGAIHGALCRGCRMTAVRIDYGKMRGRFLRGPDTAACNIAPAIVVMALLALRPLAHCHCLAGPTFWLSRSWWIFVNGLFVVFPVVFSWGLRSSPRKLYRVRRSIPG